MFRLFGLLTCASLAFIFPMFAYTYHPGIVSDAIISTTVGTIIISIVLK